MKKVIFTTGGTGGHIYPAMAVADVLRDRDVECLFVGTKHRMEKDIIGRSEYNFIGLDVKPLSGKNPLTLLKMIKSIFVGLYIVLKEKPDAIIGFGNYI